MRQSLMGRFIRIWLLFGLICFLLTALFSSRLFLRQSISGAAEEMYVQARTIAGDYRDLYTDGTIPSGMRSRLLGVNDYEGVRVWFVNPDGVIVFDSAGEYTDQTIRGFDPADSKDYYRIGRFYGRFSEDVLSVLAPVTANFTTYGYVILHKSISEITEFSDRLLPPLYITVLIVYLLSLLILLVIRARVLHPIRQITEAAGEYASGNLKHTISLSSGDELGLLADTLNVMADEISSATDYQKNFIANVSHDFRSPLTSIKGYLTAILDGVIPPEKQEKYLGVVINETERLENLTQSMLSLNSLDRQNRNLEYADFDICRLIRGVCAAFERKCQMRGISFDLILDAASITVHADMGKIQQVLYNLLDNAVKFSHDGEPITITVRKLKTRALISVKDTGVGIPREDLNKIWNRFFKSDQSRGLDKQGTGLGLSIVKEIIAAHGETIDAVSTEGSGTEFTFGLALAQTQESARTEHKEE